MRRRVGALFGAFALATSAAVVVVTVTAATPAGAATTWGPVDPTIKSGDPNSLWDILENKIGDGDTVILKAGAIYTLDNCDDPDPDIEHPVTIQGNGATIQMGCVTDEEVLDIDTEGNVSIDNVTITRAANKGGGMGIYVGEVGTLKITNSAIVNNINCDGNGGGIEFSASSGSKLVIVNSTISGNHSSSDGGGIAQDGGPADILVVNSTIANNTADYVGGIEQDDGDVTLVYSTVVDNSTGVADPAFCNVFNSGAPQADDEGRVRSESDAHQASDGEPANIRVAGAPDAIGTVNAAAPVYDKLTSFGSVVALPHGGENCGNGDTALPNTVSQGYNFADDTSCGFTGSTDRQGTGAAFDPKLGPLAANSGYAQTRLPQTGSPLIDAIPTANCSDGDTLAGSTITTDERLLVRPDVVNQKCDIGAVEVQTEKAAPDAVVIQPTFTG